MSNQEGVARRVIAIAGGAFTGSEAAAMAARQGALVLVLERGESPYGALELIPCWHFDERETEMQRIDDNLAEPGVVVVRRTALGRDVTPDALRELGVQALLSARGRPAASAQDGVLDRAALARWFNHRGDHDYPGPPLHVPDDAAVVGRGLAAIDCARMLAFLRCEAFLEARGLQTGPVPLHRDGVRRTLAARKLDPEALAPTRLYVSSPDALLPAWVDDATRAAVLARLGEDRIELAVGDAAGASSLVVRVAPAPSSAHDDGLDLSARVPDLLDLERRADDAPTAALQERLLRLRCGLEPLVVPPADADDYDVVSAAAEALIAAIAGALSDAVRGPVEAALGGEAPSPEAVAAVTAWARQREAALTAP
ncbi:MAG: hypothetical protein U1F43_21330 [Myxococcota bacterium]